MCHRIAALQAYLRIPYLKRPKIGSHGHFQAIDFAAAKLGEELVLRGFGLPGQVHYGLLRLLGTRSIQVQGQVLCLETLQPGSSPQMPSLKDDQRQVQ